MRGFAPDYLMRQKQQKPKSYHIPRRNTSRIPAYPSFSTVITMKRAGLRAIVQGVKRAIRFVIFKEAIQTFLRQT